MFVKRTGSITSDFGVSCQPTIDRGIILVATTSTNGMDVHSGLVKTDSMGTTQWAKLFMIGQWSVPQTVLQAKDEGYVVYGSATDTAFLNNNRNFLFLHKTDIYGNRHWDKQFAISNNDIAVNLIHRKAGGYIACSKADYNIGTYPRAAITTLDDAGNVIWSKQYSSTFGMQASKVIELNNGNICFISSCGDFSPSPFSDILVTMLDANGNLIWTKNFGTYYDDEPNALAVNSSDQIFITGRSIFTNRNWDGFLLKLDSSGNILHSKFYDAGTSNGEIMRCIVAGENGSCVLLGDIGTFNERDITMILVDSDATIHSAKRYLFSPQFTNYPYELFRAYDGGYVFTGDFRPPVADRDAIIAKTDTDGNVYCYNSNIIFSEFNDTLQVTTVSLNSLISSVNSRSDSSTTPNNSFTQHTLCAIINNVNTIDSENKFIQNVYPNPSPDFLNIEMGTGESLDKIIIYGIDGKTISEALLNKSEKYQINIRSLASGVYYLECVSGNKIKRVNFYKY